MYTVVVVDDEAELRRAIVRRIDWEEIGFHVTGEAENGIEALEQVEAKEPDLLLTDIRMPFLSGLELARQVREVRPATQIAFLSGYDDFTYAREAIEYNIISYILKPITIAGLKDELIRIREKLDHIFEEFSERQSGIQEISDFVVPIVLDGYRSMKKDVGEYELLKQAEACGLIKSAREPVSYVVMVTMVLDKDGGNATSREHVHAVEMIVGKYINGFHFYTNGKIVSLLTASRGGFGRYLHILAGEIAESVERIIGCGTRIGLSRVTGKLIKCHEAYREAMDAVRYGEDTSGSISFISDEERSGDGVIEGLVGIAAELENYVRAGDKAGIDGYLDSVRTDGRWESVSAELIRLFLVQVFSMAIRIVYAVADPGETEQVRKRHDMEKMVLFNGTWEEAVESARIFCLSVTDLILSQRQRSSISVCRKALRIIDENYSDPELSLASLSGEVGVSPNYLSALIKKEQNKNFTDLLTERRMEAARKLLLSTQLKVREISERCGYRDQHYFSYCFKKATGFSPNAMRQEHAKKG